MSFNTNMRKISKPVDFKGLAGTLAAGSKVYKGGTNAPVSGSRTIPGGFANQLGPIMGEKRGRPKKKQTQQAFAPSVIQARLMRGK